jgi:hypothetical protein
MRFWHPPSHQPLLHRKLLYTLHTAGVTPRLRLDVKQQQLLANLGGQAVENLQLMPTPRRPFPKVQRDDEQRVVGVGYRGVALVQYKVGAVLQPGAWDPALGAKVMVRKVEDKKVGA